jgi:hypothetical protein
MRGLESLLVCYCLSLLVTLLLFSMALQGEIHSSPHGISQNLGKSRKWDAASALTGIGDGRLDTRRRHIREHICIRRAEYVAGTATRPEVGVFTQTSIGRKPVPWDSIAAGETVWMKWSGGPVVAKAVVAGFRQLTNCSATDLRTAVAGYKLHDLDDYWFSRPPSFEAMAIYLKNEAWLDEPQTVTGRSRGSSWIVFPSAAEREKWMSLPSTNVGQIVKDPRGSRVVGASLRFVVFRRDGFTCQYCGRKRR